MSDFSLKLRGMQRLVTPLEGGRSIAVWVVPQRRSVNIGEAKTRVQAALQKNRIDDRGNFAWLMSCAEQFFGRVSQADGLNSGEHYSLDLEKAVVVAENVMELCGREEAIVGQDNFYVLIAAALLNGIGWASPDVRAENFQTDHNRKIAMKAAGEYARYVLAILGKRAGGLFRPDDHEQIAQLLDNYDLPSLDPPHFLPIENVLGLVLREADRLYMLTEEGLFADFIRQKRGMTETREILPFNAKRILAERSHYAGLRDYDVSNKLFVTQHGLVMFRQLLETFWRRILPVDLLASFYRDELRL